MSYPIHPRIQASVLCMATLLSACGGGGSDAPAPVVNLSLTAPAPANQVFDLKTSIPVSARVTIDGAAAPDGSAVLFSAQAGTFAPTSGSTRTGNASTVFTGTAAGKHTITATSTLSGITGSTTQTVYLRPNPAPLEVLVPAYFYPSAKGSDWDALIAGTRAHPGLKVTAILNPSNGIFTSAEPNYLQAAQSFVGAGGNLVGYVYTLYGKGPRTLAEIKANIDNYLQMYGRELISGIFLDEMSSDPAKVNFYKEIYSHIKSRDASLRVMGNPGLVPAADYAGVVDAIVTFEGKGIEYAAYDPRQKAQWIYTQANSSQAMLAHNIANCTAMQASIASAALPLANSGLVYATDRNFEYSTLTGNPWATLPSYWNALLDTVAAVNQGQPMPACN